MGVCVAADTEDIAEEAIKLINGEWNAVGFNLEQEDALASGAPASQPEWYPKE